MGEASLILGRGYITGDYKTEKGTPGAILDFDLLMKQDDTPDITRFFSATYDPDREVITGTWTTKWIDPEAEEAYVYEDFIARRTPLGLYFFRDIIDSPSNADAIDDAEPSLAKRRWRYAIECVRSRTAIRENSKDLTIARLKGSQELIKLHYESLGRGDFGSIQTESYAQMISLGVPNSSVCFTLYRQLARYRYDRMLDDW